MAFEAKDYSISDILNKSVFDIPRNQRRYVWKKEHWRDLYEDIVFSIAENKPHFVGSIVLEGGRKKDGLSYYTIIDKKHSEQHYLAGKMYAHAKLEVDSKIKAWEFQEVDEFEVFQYFQNNFSELNELVQIPEKEFTKLKHAHQTKVEFSKFLDTHKKDYLWLCKLKFRFGRKY